MRWFGLVLLCAVIVNVCGDPEPDPKKYNKEELKPAIKINNTTLTDEERQFLREVEVKFGIKSEVPLEKDEEEIDSDEDKTSKITVPAKLPFPAVIAIEIVNDTDTKTKGKRTIDANLGYGYRTNSGYTYKYFGKPAQEQGKFMIYPYSQEDIPPASSSSSSISNQHYPQQVGKTTKISPNVEITPSQAFELVPTKVEEPTSYNYEKPAVQLNTKYENIQGIESPPPQYNAQQTLYTTYNGEQFSGLSNQFPKVMSNYLVEPSQLLNNPTYQGVGITQDHLRPHGAHLEQRVVPVLVLRVPSSYIKDPSAELYANLPQNYPLSQYLNNVNLQDLVNQYFKKIGYPYAPKVMAYPTSPLGHLSSSIAHKETAASPVSTYQPQHYASPYVRPSYTHADYSGVQYSAVQPVMAKYPSGYTRSYYMMRPQSLYQQPLQQQHYMYRFKYVPQTLTQSQSYYTQPQQPQYRQEIEQQPQYQHVEEHQSQYQQEEEHRPQYQQEEERQPQYQQEEERQPQYQQEEEHQPQYQQKPEQQTQYQQESEEEHDVHSNGEQSNADDTESHVEYQSSSTGEKHASSAEYNYPSAHNQQENEQEQEHQHVTTNYESVSTSTPSYDRSAEVSTPDYGPTKVPFSFHGSSPSVQISYQQPDQKETVAIFPRSQTGHKAGVAQNYIYQQINNEHSGSESLVLHENYPSKDHTIATVLPLSYKKLQQQSEPVQSVSYVTPVTTMKYHSHYRVMVPQTIFRKPTDEKVSYVNSHSVPSGYSSLASSSQYQPMDPEEYSAGSHYVSGLSKLRSSSYPRSYTHTHPKRMTKPENKSDSPVTIRKSERNDKKKSS